MFQLQNVKHCPQYTSVFDFCNRHISDKRSFIPFYKKARYFAAPLSRYTAILFQFDFYFIGAVGKLKLFDRNLFSVKGDFFRFNIRQAHFDTGVARS